VKLGGKTTEKMEALSNEAIEHAKEKHGITLDYSEGSVRQVSKILQERHDNRDVDVAHFSMCYGAYIGEVILKNNAKCFWVKGHPDYGLDIYCIKFGKNFAFPIVWAEKQLESGSGDDVSHKYNVWKHNMLKE
jgi:hypothetical protein